jgi:hypothetical protein
MFSQEIKDLPVTCPSGNCTWATVPSEGTCSECIDVTHLLPKTWISCSGLFCDYTLATDGVPLADFENWAYYMTNGPKPNSTLDFSAVLSNPDDIKPYSFNISKMARLPINHSDENINRTRQWTQYHRIIIGDFAISAYCYRIYPCCLENPRLLRVRSGSVRKQSQPK